MIKVMIVDDSEFMRLTIRNLLKEEKGIEVVGEANDARKAFGKYKELNPDVVTMDVIMPIEYGLTAVKRIYDYDPEAKIIMVSAVGQEKIVNEAVEFGAKGYIVKPIKKEELIKTIHEVSEND